LRKIHHVWNDYGIVEMSGRSRENKSKWAMAAAEEIEKIGERNNDVWGFMNSVYNFLNAMAGSLLEGTPEISSAIEDSDPSEGLVQDSPTTQ